MRLLRNFIIGLVLVLIGIAALLLVPSPQPPASKPWEVTLMPDGNSKVLGIHLGQTRYGEAQTALGIFGETAIFTDSDNRASVEAYFDSINLGGLSAKLVLNLAVSEQQLASMLSRATAGKLQPSGARQHELHERDRIALLQAPVKAITYIPSVRLDKEMLTARFGEPAEIKTSAEISATETWFYPDIGLQVELNPEQKTILLYRALNTVPDA
ncbi:lytic murein transglycosylase [Methylophaga sp. OBS4]|uniref:lytic murein transglycosylase n=1 Tax=Methylophaga sp. OBS4 TaxID=2991935 RepID=UPI002256FB02|nr:lytic murein transglycosylase [Methylophaga sp. OBS4]MCX4188292.1 lytic murein transglycosylase [Methylophaga sp. OBS4]